MLLVGTGPLDILSQIVIFLSYGIFLFVNLMFLMVGVSNYFRRYKMLQEFCHILRLPSDRSASYGMHVNSYYLDLWFGCRLLLKQSFGSLYHTRVQFNLFLLTLLPVALCIYVTLVLTVPSLKKYCGCRSCFLHFLIFFVQLQLTHCVGFVHQCRHYVPTCDLLCDPLRFFEEFAVRDICWRFEASAAPFKNRQAHS